MKFILHIDCTSGPFGETHESRSAEVGRILAEIGKRTAAGAPGSVMHAGNEARAAIAFDSGDVQAGRYWWEAPHVVPEETPIGRLLVAAGYHVSDTGGGCKAWRKDFTEDGQRHALITDEDGCSLPEPGDVIVGGFYPVWGHEGWDAIRSNDVAEVIAGIAKQEAEPDTEASLTEELEIYQQEQGLPERRAAELHHALADGSLSHHEDITEEQRAWLSRFVDRWEAVMKTEDA